MKVNVPAAAPLIPPETGASRAPIPALLASFATFLELSTSTVEQSKKIVFFFIIFIASSATVLRISPFGNIVITMSASLTHSIILFALFNSFGMFVDISYPVT